MRTRIFKSTTFLCTAIAGLGLAFSAHAESHKAMAGMSASATMNSQNGTAAGEITLTETPNGVLLQGTLEDLPAGPHGFHIHENGTCEPDFAAAGDHYNPMSKEHGIMNEAGRHAGDLTNIEVSDAGMAQVEILTDTVSLAEGDASLMKEGGTAIIVHENPDSYQKDAGAGGRIACGVIKGS